MATIEFDADGLVVGEARYMPDFTSDMVKLADHGDTVSICDIFGGHRISVPKDDWESWEVTR